MPFSSDPETLCREGVTAEAIGLVRSDPSKPGWTRRRCGPGFTYKDGKGQTLKGKRAERCRALVLPPAWEDIWICPNPRGHIQATGRDEAGRLQYRYHPTWSAARNSAKFDDLIAFGHALPELRRRVRHDLTYSDCPRELRLAAIVRLLDRGALRIGRSGRKTYGAVSLRKSHVQIEGRKIICAYKGKGGTPRRVTVRDKLLAKTLDGLMAEKGAFLFRSRKVRPAAQDVNEYIQETLGLFHGQGFPDMERQRRRRQCAGPRRERDGEGNYPCRGGCAGQYAGHREILLHPSRNSRPRARQAPSARGLRGGRRP